MKDFSIELIELIASFCQSSKDKANLCLVNKLFYSTITRLLYQHIMITGPRSYVSLKDTLSRVKEIRQFVHCLDFSSYTTRGSRWSEEKARELVHPNELAKLIQDCHHLQELLIGEEMMHAGSSSIVLDSIFSKSLVTLDITGFSDKKQAVAYTSNLSCSFKNVSFFMCSGLSQELFFIPFFRQLDGTRLEKLDMSHTQITSSLFSNLSNTHNLTHLNLQGCYSLTCCSPLITFIEQNAHSLVELNLNIKHSKFCTTCLYRIISSLNHNKLKSLNLGGHLNFSDMLIHQLLSDARPFPQLQYLTIHSSLSLLHKFISHIFPHVLYVQLSDPVVVPFILGQANPSIQVIEVNLSKKYPNRLLDWRLITHGNRSFYARPGVDPRFVYSKKLVFNDQLSPMNKYWSYST